MSDIDQKMQLPVVPLRDMVIFPGMMAPFVVGRKASVEALEAAVGREDPKIFLLTQKDPKVDDPQAEDLYSYGTIARIVQKGRMATGNLKVVAEGLERARVRKFIGLEPHIEVEVERRYAQDEVTPAVRKYMDEITELFKEYAKLSHHLSADGVLASLQTRDINHFADILAAHLSKPSSEKQKILEMENPLERLQLLNDLIDIEIDRLHIDRRISSRVKKQMEKSQREYYLSEKIKAINEELGRKDLSEELKKLRQQVEEAGMSEEAKDRALKEIGRLESMPPASAESGVSRNYVDWLLSVPWRKASREIRDIRKAEEVLENDHFGLEKVKERILEFLAVRQISRKTQGTILCFVGPPGVGKTSLARSIARATGRKFVRLSLGGVRDEAEIRGHRRTYIGAFPGQIIQMMKKAATINPVILLDEVDKMASDFRGDPAGAMLEVLDPEQNNSFHDHYLDVDYDLSKVLFVCTANVTHTIPPALKDRMETIELSSYTHLEKLEIARNFLLPRQIDRHGLKPWKISFEEEALRFLIERYTRESGVRNLEREISSVCRKLARQILKDGLKKGSRLNVDPGAIRQHLGAPRFRELRREEMPEPGIACGLAWTQVGGELLTTEVLLMRGKGQLTLTGQLGDVMQESARAALSFVKSRADDFGIDPETIEKTDIHIHVPEGAIPKDGPSAGITLCTALVSALTGTPVRVDVAMTGELTLRGRVLPIGGLKEKAIAAYRAGIMEVIIPEENEKDLEEIPEELRKEMDFVMVKNMDRVLERALVASPWPAGTPGGQDLKQQTAKPMAH